MTCPDEGFQWFKVIEIGKQLLNSTSRTYTINVTTVELGGQIYECECGVKSICFIVWGKFLSLYNVILTTAENATMHKEVFL